MAVTGDTWLSLSLGQMVPEIDPNNPGSAASLVRDKINEVEGRFQQTVDAANDTIARAAQLLDQLRVVGATLTGVQSGLEELAQNAGNTGVYFRLIGICPDFPNSLLRNNNEFAAEVSKVMNVLFDSSGKQALEQRIARAEIDRDEQLARAEALEDDTSDAAESLRDQALSNAQEYEQEVQAGRQQLQNTYANVDECMPNFVGESAYVGGLVGVVGAPNPLALWGKLKVLAEIFPGLKDIIKDAGGKLIGFTEATVDFLDTFSGENLTALAERFNNFREELEQMDESPFFNSDKLLVTNGCDKWSCSRLADIMPMLDVNAPGSPLNLAVDFTGQITSGVVGGLQRVAALAGTANTLIGTVAQFQSDLNAFKNKVFEFADNLASTGVFIHSIGRDGSINNNSEFVDAVIRSLNDPTDAGRPTFRGDTAVVAGFLIVIGAPNFSSLTGKFQAVSSAINGFDGKIKAVSESAGRVGEAFEKFKGAVSTSDVDSQFTVNQTAPQRGGTDSSLLAAGRLLLQGNNPFQSSTETIPAEKAVRVNVATSESTPIQQIDMQKTEVPRNVPVEEGPSAVETRLIEGEEEIPSDSGASTQSIAPLLRSAKRVSGGLG